MTARRALGPVPPRIAQPARDAFARFIAEPAFPCLGARSALRRGGCRVAVYGAMGTDDTTRALAMDLGVFVAETARRPASPTRFVSFVALFLEPAPTSEVAFEHALWDQLTHLSSVDPSPSWADGVADDPDDAHFAFSFDGAALFVIGLHPESSRLARRFEWPALVFNPHAQFARLRAEQRFERLRASVRAREIALQGGLNPNLADAGEQSEARQYSGRAVDDAWRCPFHRTRR